MSYKFTTNCLKFSSALFCMLFFQLAFSQVSKKNVKEIGTQNFQELDDLVQKNQKLLGNNIVAMVWTDTLVYKRELGELDSKTLVPIASSSKWLTAAMVMKFVEQGKISLDDKVSQYIPIFELYGKNYITIRHCLSHFTGIQSDGNGVFGKKKFGSLEEEVASFAKKEIKTNPGTEFSYSNIGLNIAGRILEIVGKKKFDMLIKQQLFNPLAMRQSTFSTPDNSALNPSGGALSNANEFMHFLQMLLNKGKYNGVQVLSEESVNELRKIQTSAELIKSAPKTALGFNYALGSWAIEEGKDGLATNLASPGLFGSWPMIDWCRGYAFLFLTKTMLNEQKKDVYMQMKDAVDEKRVKKCD